MNDVNHEEVLNLVWLLENGLFRGKAVKGDPPKEWRDGKSFPEAAVGWERRGVRFIHATRARCKPAELGGGLLQNFMERVLGYCGREARHD